MQFFAIIGTRMSYDEAQLPNPMELPSVEQKDGLGAQPDVKQQGSERNPEYLPSAHGAQNNLPTDDSIASQIKDPVQRQQPAHNQAAQQQTGLSANAPSIADDVDLIEKEWVEKAKEIVEKTRDNPYLQNKAISEMKADYIKKRYNKDVSKSGQ